MDHHSILVLHRGNVAAAAERAAGRNRREVAVYVLWRLKPFDASGRRVVGDADAGDRHAADLERIALALEDEGAVAPTVADADGDGAARQFDHAVRRLRRRRAELPKQKAESDCRCCEKPFHGASSSCWSHRWNDGTVFDEAAIGPRCHEPPAPKKPYARRPPPRHSISDRTGKWHSPRVSAGPRSSGLPPGGRASRPGGRPWLGRY